MTCCALHNWLQNIDGLDEKWDNGVPSEWEGELRHLDDEDVQRYVRLFALQQLHSPAARQQYDTSGMGIGLDQKISDEEEGEETNSEQGH